MKVKGMIILVIKLATICLCINSVLSAALSDVQKSNSNEGSSDINKSTTISTIDSSTTIDTEDYDSNNNASNEEKSTSTSEVSDTKQPPLVFPLDDEKTETSKNETALEILQKNSNASMMEESSKVLTESPSTTDDHDDDDDDTEKKANISDYEDGSNNKSNETSQQQQEQQEQQQEKEKDYDNVTGDDDEEEENEKSDVENIQDDENKDQGYLEEQFGYNSTSINPFEEPKLHGGHLAIIFASILILFSVVAYIGLVLWRNRLERTYGMRQRLVTEDDYYNNNDVRFFGL